MQINVCPIVLQLCLCKRDYDTEKSSICARGKVNRNSRQVLMVRHRSIQAEVPAKHEVMKPHAQRCRAAAGHTAVTPSRERGCAPSSPPFPPEEVGTKPDASRLSTPAGGGFPCPWDFPAFPFPCGTGRGRQSRG